MFAKKTVRIRHAIIRLIAPKIYAQTVPKKTRPFTIFVKNKFNNKSLMGAEIGVSRGINALNILQNLNMEKLFLIDPYEAYITTSNKLFSKVEVNKNLGHAKGILAKYNDVVQFILLRSSEAVKDFLLLKLTFNAKFLFTFSDYIFEGFGFSPEASALVFAD